ncbi:hypothetical protein CPJCM30710_25210 [Clostridium polyendosporum]|uniref:Uncharacterized protein n=1 Tax=Clostridium polyendosporum TaxID=69208 RepID=A0A919S099_9CLOT|nr:hypothetical protein [Clostridium polyendosporum]GIM29855.1 hypothetical protein CPJCM30710_25210 [Clostridium polyendosporum]
MNKLKKILGSVLCALMLVSIGFYNNTVKANAQDISQNVHTIEKTKDGTEAIKIIEQRFLTQNSDGTTTINMKANKYIDSKLLKQIKDGSEAVNKKIKDGDLIYDKSTKELHEKQHATPCTTVSGYYIWHWYGFDFVMNAYNAGIFSAKLSQYASVLAGGAAVAGLFSGGGGAFVLGCSSATIYYWSSVAAEGAANGRGAITYYFGSPSWAQLYKVWAR